MSEAFRARQAQLGAIYEQSTFQPKGPDWLYPCPGCGQRGAKADMGHYLCRRCEGFTDEERHKDG